MAERLVIVDATKSCTTWDGHCTHILLDELVQHTLLFRWCLAFLTALATVQAVPEVLEMGGGGGR